MIVAAECPREAARLLTPKHLFIFDMDGTIYLGGRPFAFAVAFIRRLRESGRRVLFFTNNASHDPVFYLDKLTRLGFSPSPEEICTSGNVTAAFLTRRRAGRSVYLLGTRELWRQFSAAGIDLVNDEDGHVTGGRIPDIVVTSFDTTLTYEKLTNACTFIRGGAEYLSTHPDFNCPTEDGFIPDSGAIAAAVTASTGVTPVYFGKPYPETVEMIGEITGEPKEKTLLFGDRLYTDIATGKRHGITAALVLTGETTMDDVNRASEAERPDLLLDSLADADRLLFGIDGNV
ncbi:MAG: HAD-IIA family hydrolase [Clostridia bacterium]|nr:HAD-IIA family hydrolase [Clostridia bacterium]MBR5366139.1 HAD-IIA family hydrolase [Clostridia bacterium]